MSDNKKTRKKGKGGKRKLGRMARKPAHTRYNNEGRREANKAKKAARQKKIEARHKAKKAKRR